MGRSVLAHFVVAACDVEWHVCRDSSGCACCVGVVMSPKLTAVASDPINRLLALSNGEVLRMPLPNSRGEYDSFHDFSKRDVRRLTGAGLLAKSAGLPADVLADIVASNGGPSFNGDELVSWWFSESIVGLDRRAADRNANGSSTPWELRERPDEEIDEEFAEIVAPIGVTPQWCIDWLARTVHGPKLDFLCELVAWRFFGGDEPATPGASWGVKCRSKFDWRCVRGGV